MNSFKFLVYIAIFLALLIRLALFPDRSLDFINFLDKWYNFILEHNGFDALKYNFSDYNYPYLYLLIIASYLFKGLSSLYSIKIISTIFDYIAAFWVYKIVELKYPNSLKPFYACICVLFAPSVFLNSAYLAQCDAIYTSFLLACLYFLLIKKKSFALISYGLAYSFKQQAIFLAPAIVILWLKKYISFKDLLWIPLSYLVTLLPALAIRKNLGDLFSVYFSQSTNYNSLAKAVTNLYQWIPYKYYKYNHLIIPAGILLTAIIVGSLIFYFYKNQKLMDDSLIIKLFFVSSLIVPYCLPKMHDRYFFVADILSIIYAFYFPKYFYFPFLIIFSSAYAITPPLRKYKFGLKILSLVVLFVLLVSLKELIKTTKTSQSTYSKYD